jgi:hypothetical protein
MEGELVLDTQDEIINNDNNSVYSESEDFTMTQATELMCSLLSESDDEFINNENVLEYAQKLIDFMLKHLSYDNAMSYMTNNLNEKSCEVTKSCVYCLKYDIFENDVSEYGWRTYTSYSYWSSLSCDNETTMICPMCCVDAIIPHNLYDPSTKELELWGRLGFGISDEEKANDLIVKFICEYLEFAKNADYKSYIIEKMLAHLKGEKNVKFIIWDHQE